MPTITYITAAMTQGAFEAVTISERTSHALTDGSWGIALIYMAAALAGLVAFLTVLGYLLIYVERKIAARFQCRLGPMRVGWHGILQTVADSIKLLLKEDVIPEKADQAMHLLAPFLSMMATVMVLGLLPYSPIYKRLD